MTVPGSNPDRQTKEESALLMFCEGYEQLTRYVEKLAKLRDGKFARLRVELLGNLENGRKENG